MGMMAGVIITLTIAIGFLAYDTGVHRIFRGRWLELVGDVVGGLLIFGTLYFLLHFITA